MTACTIARLCHARLRFLSIGNQAAAGLQRNPDYKSMQCKDSCMRNGKKHCRVLCCLQAWRWVYLEVNLEQPLLLSSSNEQKLVAIRESLHWLVVKVTYSPIWVEGGQDCLATQGGHCSTWRAQSLDL